MFPSPLVFQPPVAELVLSKMCLPLLRWFSLQSLVVAESVLSKTCFPDVSASSHCWRCCICSRRALLVEQAVRCALSQAQRGSKRLSFSSAVSKTRHSPASMYPHQPSLKGFRALRSNTAKSGRLTAQWVSLILDCSN